MNCLGAAVNDGGSLDIAVACDAIIIDGVDGINIGICCIAGNGGNE